VIPPPPSRYSPMERRRLWLTASSNALIGVAFVVLYVVAGRHWWQLLIAALFIVFGVAVLLDLRRTGKAR
jgi:energy-coupling factor transporter transmembrane protein EcfT